MKNIAVVMLCIPMCVLSAEKQLRKDINTALITHHLPYDSQSMGFLKPKARERLTVFSTITKQYDEHAEIIPLLPPLTPAFPVSQAQVISQPGYVIPAKRIQVIGRNSILDRKKEILCFIALEKINARKGFKGGHILQNNKGIITETIKQTSRSFDKKDVDRVVVNEDLTFEIVLKNDISKK